MKKEILKAISLIAVLVCIAFCVNNVNNVTPPSIGKAPDIELVSPKGKVFKLSKLKGKVVLVDFWASWCGPCRKESPNVVEAYQKYHKKKFTVGKGFEVFSVSLDREEKAWKEAIKADGLVWKYHGLDKESKASNAYGVRSIPSAFLISGDGEIIASGNELRGLNLHIKLDQYLSK